ncbi:hypothetical protein TorRG33x02_350040, partial [Trema orientale]
PILLALLLDVLIPARVWEQGFLEHGFELGGLTIRLFELGPQVSSSFAGCL